MTASVDYTLQQTLAAGTGETANGFTSAGLTIKDDHDFLRGRASLIAGGPVSDGGYFTETRSGTLTVSVEVPDGGIGYVELWALTSAKAEGSVETVPVPSALLLGSIGLGIAGRKLRRRKTAQ